MCARSGLLLVLEFGIRRLGFGFRSGVIIVIMARAFRAGFPTAEVRIPNPGVFLNA